jgi:hypothetical protein
MADNKFRPAYHWLDIKMRREKIIKLEYVDSKGSAKDSVAQMRILLQIIYCILPKVCL